MVKLFLAILLLFGAVVLGIFFVWPEWTRRQNLLTDNNDLTRLSEEFDRFKSSRDDLNRQIEKITKEKRDRLEKAIPRGVHAPEFLILMENLTNANGILLSSINISSEDKGQKNPPSSAPKTASNTEPSSSTKVEGIINEYPVNIAITAQYESLKRFMKDLEQSLRLVDVSDVSFGGMEKKTDSTSISIKLKTYYQ